MATPHRFELRRSDLETDMLPLTSGGNNMEVREGFEPTVVEICSHLPWTTRPPHCNFMLSETITIIFCTGHVAEIQTIYIKITS